MPRKCHALQYSDMLGKFSVVYYKLIELSVTQGTYIYICIHTYIYLP